MTIDTRACRIGSGYQAIDSRTSSEWIWGIVEKMQTVDLHEATYSLDFEDGSLRRSAITGLAHIGCAWREGMRQPLKFGKTSSGKKREPTIREDDPFGDAAAERAGQALSRVPRCRGSGPGRGRARGRKRGRGSPSEALADGVGEDPPPPPLLDGAGEPEAAPPDGPRGEQYVDMADTDCASSIQSVEELEAAFEKYYELPATLAEPAPPEPAMDPRDKAVEPRGPDELDPDAAGIHDAAMEFVADAAAGAAEHPADPDQHPGEPEPAAPPPPAAAAPWEALSDMTPQGYFYMGGRRQLRIEREKPRRGTTYIHCYRHRRCSLLVTSRCCGSDLDIKRWLFDIPATPDGATSEEAASLVARHLNLGRARWAAAPKARAKARAFCAEKGDVP